MSFTFKLQPLLKHRTLLENQARQALAEALAEEAALQQVIEEHCQARQALQQEFEDKKALGMDWAELLIYDRSLKRRAARLRELQAQARELQAQSEQRRACLTEASRDKTLMENLRTRMEDEHRQEMLRREMVHLDEVALQLGKNRL
ncbi:MAG: flagellar export protein FliJ [Syntrophotalea sp.]|jgi:flagellar FliJ protein|uniref:flagellar export protein FliJ n=1 Tax=Syntrophotalea sp. TaxID=2812029 RepID=UPI003D0FAE31